MKTNEPKNIWEANKFQKLRNEALAYCQKLIREDEATYDKASALREKLGLGGLWIGADLALMEIAKAIRGEKCTSK